MTYIKGNLGLQTYSWIKRGGKVKLRSHEHHERVSVNNLRSTALQIIIESLIKVYLQEITDLAPKINVRVYTVPFKQTKKQDKELQTTEECWEQEKSLPREEQNNCNTQWSALKSHT